MKAIVVTDQAAVGRRVFGLADWYRDGTLADYLAGARRLAFSRLLDGLTIGLAWLRPDFRSGESAQSTPPPLTIPEGHRSHSGK
jgi:hypothetical protein